MRETASRSDQDNSDDYDKRLARYGLDRSAVLQETLVTAPGAETFLSSGRRYQTALRSHLLQTTSFAQLKEWIGVPDAAINSAGSRLMTSLPKQAEMRLMRAAEYLKDGVQLARAGSHPAVAEPAAAVKEDEVTREDIYHVRSLARSYLRGDSRQVRVAVELIEKVIGLVEIAVWPILDVTVKSGSVLSFGPGAHVLLVRTLTIEHGGLVRSYGTLTVDGAQLVKERRFKFVDINKHGLHLSNVGKWAIATARRA